MGNSIAKLFATFFGKQEMRILMVSSHLPSYSNNSHDAKLESDPAKLLLTKHPQPYYYILLFML